MKKIIVALGGNAIQSGKNSAQVQQLAVRDTVYQLMPLVSDDYEVVITHGNGPQVGQLMLQQKAADSDLTPALPLNTCVAMTQGMIGCWIQHEFVRALGERAIDKEVISIVTQVEVDMEDPAFMNPTKPVGPFYSEEEAEHLAKENPDHAFMEDAGRGIRRVVASPVPRCIPEATTISSLTGQGKLVIAVGGGGVPVAKVGNELQLVDAVIDKDLASAKLAELIGADTLIILTAVSYVYLNYGKPNQKKLEEVTVDEMEDYIAEGHFAVGSMLPKVEACCMFLRNKPGGTAIISSLENLPEVLSGGAGTVIHA